MVTHHINTGTAKSNKQQLRQASPSIHSEIDRQAYDLLDTGLVKKSSMSLVLSGGIGNQEGWHPEILRGQVGAVTVKDAYPLHCIDDFLFALSGARWF